MKPELRRARQDRDLEPDPLTEVKAIYAALEARPLERQCRMRTQCCRFRLTGQVPQVTLGEAMLAAQGVRASGRKAVKPRTDGACPLLGRDDRCTIYAHRPFGCRTHFCQAAGGLIPRRHIADLIHRLEALDEKLRGNGPRDFVAALEDELARKR